jgi:hypothetical protein
MVVKVTRKWIILPLDKSTSSLKISFLISKIPSSTGILWCSYDFLFLMSLLSTFFWILLVLNAHRKIFKQHRRVKSKSPFPISQSSNSQSLGNHYCNSFPGVLFFLQYCSLNSGPIPWATPPTLFCDGFFQDRLLRTIWPGWVWTSILRISASSVAWIIGVSHRHPDFQGYS